ncbi:MAG: hemolysin family protein [Gammaproteobacteria bacterium]
MTIVYIIILLVANAFFVAAEFALVKVQPVRINVLAEEGGKAAKMTRQIMAKLETYLATCQLGITMASLGLGWIGEPAVAALLTPMLNQLGFSMDTVHIVSFLVGFIIFSSLHIVVGEQVPKTYAIRESDTVSLWVAYPLHFSYLITFPLTWALNIASNATLKLLGVASVSHAEILSGAEIQGLIDVSREHGEIEDTHASMMQNLFAFHDLPVERIMLPKQFVETIELNSTKEELINQIDKTKHSRLAVIDRSWDNFHGVVLVKELLLSIVNNDVQVPLNEFPDLIREPQLVPESQPIAMLFNAMQENRNHIAFVLSEYGEIAGLVSMEDLLEEIVGEISDEYDGPESGDLARKKGDGWQCHGSTLLIDLERLIGFKFDPSHSANTVTGLFMKLLARLPVTGDRIDTDGFAFEIKEMKGRHPTVVSISRSEQKEAAQSDNPDTGIS